MQTREGLKTYNERKRTEPHRPWYTKFCEEKRKTYRKCQNKYRKKREIGNLKNLQVASKIYKKTLNAAFEKHKKTLCDKIPKLKSTNPRDYWALLKNCNKKQNESDQLNIDTFYKNFSNLNKNRYTETVSLDELISDRNIDPNPLLTLTLHMMKYKKQ